MTIDQLRARKKDLLEQRQRIEQGGDKLALALLKEELLDVNAQLRALTHGRRKTARDTSSSLASDRQQFENWQHREDQKENPARKNLRSAAVACLEGLTPKQRETLALYAGGMRQDEIAARLGVNPSTVSRTLSRAKRNAADHVTQVMEGERLLGSGQMVSLDEPEALRAVVRSMTPKQMIYFYLYYSEGLSQREIEDLIGVDHTAVCRTLRRALSNLDRLFGGQPVAVTHPEAVDEAAYLAWQELELHPELVPEEVKPLLSNRQKGYPAEYYRKYRRKGESEKPAVIVRQTKKDTSGKLLSLLLERTGEGKTGLFGWLEKIFEMLKRKWKGSRP